MNRNRALEIYQEGQEAVITTLIDQDRQITELSKTVKEQELKIAKLKKNSSNSSKPPSSDVVNKPKPQNKDGKRKIGGQKGHPIHERQSFPPQEINRIHDHHIEICPFCTHDDIIWLPGYEPRILQQMELKEIVVIKEEHRAYAYWCNHCRQVHYAPFPENIAREGLFKAQITALVAYMSNVCHSSFSTIRKFFRDVLHEPISRGYLAKVIQKVSRALEQPYEELLRLLPLESLINIDETGHKDNGKRFWTWVFKAELYVLFKIDKSRGSQVLIEVLGKEFDGIIGCDYFSAYRKFMREFDVSLQFCLAHLIRDIKFLVDQPDQETQTYGANLLARVKELFKIIHNRESMEEPAFTNALENTKQAIIKTAVEDVPSFINADGKEEKKAAFNMANRFMKHGEAYFTFITTPGMDPTNNTAERAIRFIVIDRYVKQGTRGLKGRQANERIWTVIATCELNGRSAFNFILKAVEAYFNSNPSPSLIPDTS
jgi:transposase